MTEHAVDAANDAGEAPNDAKRAVDSANGTASIPLKMKCSFPPRLFPHTFYKVGNSPTPK